MTNNDKRQWLSDFNEFSNLNAEEHSVPTVIFEKLKARLFPNPWRVFLKILGLHLIVGAMSLVICNQFGLNPFNTDQSLTRFFMQIGGHHLCMFFCGVFFMGTTYLLANLFINLEEVEAIRRYEWLQTGLVGLLSLATFYFFGAELIATFVGLWFLGAIISGYASIEASYRLRRYFA